MQRRLGLLTVTAVLALTAIPASALGWSNGGGGKGLGTHRWLFYHADMMAVKQGATWVRLGTALPRTADPDFVINDRNDHNYDRWNGEHYGNAHYRVAYFYRRAVKYLRAGNKSAASRMVGLMSHYYVDTWEPLHTQESGGETVAVHTGYEQEVDARLRTSKRNAKWLRYDGYTHVADSAKFTVAAATTSHSAYSKLLSRFRSHGFNSSVRSITATELNHAANGLADLLMSIQQDAAVRAKSPDLGAHVGVSSDGSFYYVVDQDRITKYDAKWRSIATTSGLAAGLEGTITPRVAPGCVVGSRLYVPLNDSAVPGNVHILVFDAGTLQRVGSIATSATADVNGIAFVAGGAHGTFFALSAGDTRHLLKFDGSTWQPTGALTLKHGIPTTADGLAYRNGGLFVSAGSDGGLGRLYRADLKGGVKLVFTSGLPGFHRGIGFRGKDLVWLVDAGAGNSRAWTLRLP